MNILIKKTNFNAKIPTRMTNGSSGWDIFSCLEKDLIIEPKSLALVDTGISIAIPKGYEGQIRPRSGLALKHQIGILNSPGTIDSDYRGEIKIILYNFGKENFVIKTKMRIAQLVISQYQNIDFIETEELPSTQRGDKGFGHSNLD